MEKISINQILGDILLELPKMPSSQELFKIKRFIQKACKLMQVTHTLDTRVAKLPIVARRTILPSDAISLIAVWINNDADDDGDLPHAGALRLQQAYNDYDYLGNIEYALSDNVLFIGDERQSEVWVKYTAPEVDDEGFWLVPNIASLHEAIYWFVMMKLSGTGYPTPFPHQYCYQMFEQVHAPRAMQELKRWTPEDAELARRTHTRLFWDYDKWHMFGQSEYEKLDFELNYGLRGTDRS